MSRKFTITEKVLAAREKITKSDRNASLYEDWKKKLPISELQFKYAVNGRPLSATRIHQIVNNERLYEVIPSIEP